VDEISNSLSHLPSPATQSFLVLSYLAHCDKVIPPTSVFLSLIFVHCRSLRDVEVTDVRSDDEDGDDDDDDDDDTKDAKED
jgi:hypothetical protein